MNTHKHARLTFLRRLEMVQQLIAHQVCVPEAARAYGVTAPTVRKWLGRFLAQGQAGLADASSRPTVSPRAIAPAKALAIVELRRKRLTQARIAQALGVSASTVSRVLARAGLSHLADLEPAEPVVRYEHQAPGDLLHIDIKKLGRIQRPGHRVTGNRRDTVEGAGWDFVFVAIDDHARVAFTDIHPDERFPSAVQFLKDAVAYYQRLGVTIQRLLTDNGSAFRSRAFAALCHELGIKHRFTRPYRPQTNGKAERFIQSALREWAYAHTYQNSQHRADAMKSWLHHYNWHRPHQGIGCTHLQTQPGRIQPIDSSQLAALRRQLILEAAERVFARDGLENTTIRAIAKEADCTTGAIYPWFDGKEAIYGAVLEASLQRLRQSLADALRDAVDAQAARSVIVAFFNYYTTRQTEFSLGLYLFRGLGPRGLGREMDDRLNARLRTCVELLGTGLERTRRWPAERIALEEMNTFTYLMGLLLLFHTRRLKSLGQQAESLLDSFITALEQR
ncbi:transposase, IS481 family [Bordetella pertussis 2356847]|nr:transposase, IS481 family [Bordetella pertussis 2356847]